MTAQNGSSIVDALVAAGLAGVALTLLVRGAGVTAAAIGTTADTAVLLDLSTMQLERLRLWPAPDGTDTPTVAGQIYHRRWTQVGGRGLPRRLTVTATSAHRSLTVASEAFP